MDLSKFTFYDMALLLIYCATIFASILQCYNIEFESFFFSGIIFLIISRIITGLLLSRDHSTISFMKKAISLFAILLILGMSLLTFGVYYLIKDFNSAQTTNSINFLMIFWLFMIGGAIIFFIVLMYAGMQEIRRIRRIQNTRGLLDQVEELFFQIQQQQQNQQELYDSLIVLSPGAPLDQKEIQLLNPRKIKADILTKSFTGNNICAICTDNFQVNDNIIDLPCMHFYHETCIISWLKKKGICPYCNSLVRPFLPNNI